MEYRLEYSIGIHGIDVKHVVYREGLLKALRDFYLLEGEENAHGLAKEALVELEDGARASGIDWYVGNDSAGTDIIYVVVRQPNETT